MPKTAGALVIVGSLFLCAGACGQSNGQIGATRDPQALSIIAESLRAQGDQAIAKVQDFTATGSITYFVANEPVSGSVEIKGKGTHSYRLSSQVPKGTQTWSTTHLKAYSQDSKGRVTSIPAHNSVNLAALTAPALNLYEAYVTKSAAVMLIGRTTFETHSVYQIRTQRNFDEKEGLSGALSKLSVRDFFLDTTSLIPVGMSWTSHPLIDYKQEIPEQVTFEDFSMVNGWLVPMKVTEHLAGQKRWTMELTKVEVNSGVADSDFESK